MKVSGRSLLLIVAVAISATGLLAQQPAPAPAAVAGVVPLTGRVTSDANQPLPYAQVSIAGLGGPVLGAQTRDNGRYTINIPTALVTGQTVQVTARAVGYKSKTLPPR